jgi:hypothetical protein
MQIYFDVAADVAKIGTELQDQLTHAEAGDEAFVTANDNALQWPFIPFQKVGMHFLKRRHGILIEARL